MKQSTPQPASQPAICDYEGSTYRTDFWEGQGREYEDRVERVALQSLLPPHGRYLVELGAGYGRLADLYGAFERVVLSDRALSQMQQAKDRLEAVNSPSPQPSPAGRGSASPSPSGRGDGGEGEMPHFHFVVCDVYALPFRAQAVDQVVSVRMLHHLVDVPRAFAEIERILSDGGCYITEFASKRHLKAILRYALGRQPQNPFSPAPHEFAKLNFDFHPRWLAQQLQQAGLHIEARRAVSHFRAGRLKRTVPLGLLVAADRALQRVGALWPWTPSVFVKARKGHTYGEE